MWKLCSGKACHTPKPSIGPTTRQPAPLDCLEVFDKAAELRGTRGGERRDFKKGGMIGALGLVGR